MHLVITLMVMVSVIHVIRDTPRMEICYPWAKEEYPTKKENNTMSFTPKAVTSFTPEDPSSGNYVAMRNIQESIMRDYNVLNL